MFGNSSPNTSGHDHSKNDQRQKHDRITSNKPNAKNMTHAQTLACNQSLVIFVLHEAFPCKANQDYDQQKYK